MLTNAYKGFAYLRSIGTSTIMSSAVGQAPRGNRSDHASGNTSFEKQDCATGKIHALSLYEAISTCIPTASNAMCRIIVMQMAGRWRHLISQHPPLPRREIRNYRDELVKLTALPYDVALRHVNLWLPWAVNRLREEVEELARALDVNPETVSHGADAPEDPGDDELLL